MDTLTISILVTFGALAGLVILLAILIWTFSSAKLTDKMHALGLPEGSVRAMLALSLVAVYLILAFYLLASPTSREVKLQGISAAEKERVLKDIPPERWTLYEQASQGKAPTFNVSYQSEGRVANDTAVQVLTAIGALVTSVVAFYFGSQSATQGVASALSAAASGQPPTLTGIDPSAQLASAGKIDLTLTGSNLEKANGITLVHPDGTKLLATEVRSSQTTVAGKIDLSQAKGGDWKVSITTSDQRTADLSTPFNVSPPSK